jgi:hypothetical protein
MATKNKQQYKAIKYFKKIVRHRLRGSLIPLPYQCIHGIISTKKNLQINTETETYNKEKSLESEKEPSEKCLPLKSKLFTMK